MHEVGCIDSVVSRERNHEAVVEGARALHEGILLLLQHEHHAVDQLTVSGGSTHVQYLLVLLAHLQECLLHLKLPPKLVVLNHYDTKEHQNMVAAGQESQHAILSAHWHGDGQGSWRSVIPPG